MVFLDFSFSCWVRFAHMCFPRRPGKRNTKHVNIQKKTDLIDCQKKQIHLNTSPTSFKGSEAWRHGKRNKTFKKSKLAPKTLLGSCLDLQTLNLFVTLLVSLQFLY